MAPPGPPPEGAYPIDGEGVWCEIMPGAARGGAALFLDRDGVVIEDRDYVARAADMRLIAGAASLVAAANRARIPVVIVTNQSGIARGLYGWAEFAAVEAALVAALAAEGARLDAVYATPHVAGGAAPYDHPDHPARKPNPGMLTRAARDLALDLARSWLVGDKAADIEAARRAGLAGAVHVLTGHGAKERTLATARVKPGFELRLARSIADLGDLVAELARG
ncbi:MAG TPA: HAD-IIIA family hydrolase [Alphaproteobacteria bacterium]|nr:HAD-IIIA family hydrolase [Alphaproteobacteria bacterium]